METKPLESNVILGMEEINDRLSKDGLTFPVTNIRLVNLCEFFDTYEICQMLFAGKYLEISIIMEKEEWFTDRETRVFIPIDDKSLEDENFPMVDYIVEQMKQKIKRILEVAN